jgi:hypothetical protein
MQNLHPLYYYYGMFNGLFWLQIAVFFFWVFLIWYKCVRSYHKQGLCGLEPKKGLPNPDNNLTRWILHVIGYKGLFGSVSKMLQHTLASW